MLSLLSDPSLQQISNCSLCLTVHRQFNNPFGQAIVHFMIHGSGQCPPSHTCIYFCYPIVLKGSLFHTPNLPRHSYLQCISSWTTSRWQGLLGRKLQIAFSSISFCPDNSVWISYGERHRASPKGEKHREIRFSVNSCGKHLVRWNFKNTTKLFAPQNFLHLFMSLSAASCHLRNHKLNFIA